MSDERPGPFEDDLPRDEGEGWATPAAGEDLLAPSEPPFRFEPAPPPTPPNPFSTIQLRWLALSLVGSGLVYFPTILAIGGGNVVDPQRLGLVTISVWAYATPLLWMFFAYRRAGIAWPRVVGRPRPGSWFEAPGMAFVQLMFGIPSFLLLLYLLSLAMPANARNLLEHPERLGVSQGSTPAPLFTFLLVVLAPIAEELIFRGLLLNTLAARWGVRPAMLAVAVGFGLLHPNPLAMFLFSLVLSTLYLRSRSLLVPMLCHIVNNVVPTLAMFAFRDAATEDAARAGTGMAPTLAGLQAAVGPMLVGCVLSGGLLFLFISRNWPAKDAGVPVMDGAIATDG